MMRRFQETTVKDWQRADLKRFYDRDKGFKDGTEVHCELIEKLVPQGGRFLEIGSGPTNPTSRRLSKLGELCGIDPGSSVLENEDLAEAKVFDGVKFPYEDNSFDACFSTYVMEHVKEGEAHMAEVYRVLKPGGLYIFRAANVFHYVTMTARLTPFWFHKIANWLREMPEDFEGPYPTWYRLSTGGQVRRAATKAGLEIQSMDYIEKEPWYGMVFRPLFWSFVAYERLVNSTELLRQLRSTMLGVLRKPENAQQAEDAA